MTDTQNLPHIHSIDPFSTRVDNKRRFVPYVGGVAVTALRTFEIQSVTGQCGCLYPCICVSCVCDSPIRGRAAFCTLSHTIPSGAWLCETALSQASRPCSLAFPKCCPAGGRLSRPPEWHTHTLLAGEGGTAEKEGG